MEASPSYSFAALPRNGCLDGVLGEAPRGQKPPGLGAPASSRDDPLGTRPFRLELGQRCLDRLAGDAAPLEIVSNQRVAEASLGESRRA